jgi:hypothetical protein
MEQLKNRINEIIRSSEQALQKYREQAGIFGESELYRANAHAKIYAIHKMRELLKFIDELQGFDAEKQKFSNETEQN